MQQHHNTGAGECASVPAIISRRSILRGFAGGAAAGAVGLGATVAVAAIAAPEAPLTDQEQLYACVEQMKVILQRLHPDTLVVRSDYVPEGGHGAFVMVHTYNTSRKYGNLHSVVDEDKINGYLKK